MQSMKKTGDKYQIKSRRLTKHNRSRQLGVIRNLDQKLFDYLIAVIFNEFLIPQEIWQIPIDMIPKYAKFSEHQNGHILILAGSILQDKKIKKTALRLLAYPQEHAVVRELYNRNCHNLSFNTCTREKYFSSSQYLTLSANSRSSLGQPYWLT